MEAWCFTPQGKFYGHKLECLDDLALFFKFEENDREPWLKYSSCGYPLVVQNDTVIYMAYHNTPGKEINVPATRMLVDLELFEVRRGESLWDQCVQGDVIFFRVEKVSLFDLSWRDLCNCWHILFRVGETLPYNILEAEIYNSRTEQPTKDWLNVLWGDPERVTKLWGVCYPASQMTASSHDKIVGAVLAVLVRRMEPTMWESNQIRSLF